MEARNGARFNHTPLRLGYFVFFKIFKMSHGGCSLLPREVLFETLSVHVEFVYHFVNVFDMILQLVLLTFNSLVPQHCEESFDESLRFCRIPLHF